MAKYKKCALSGCQKPARKRFCSDKHKDRYHNKKNPRGFYEHLNPSNDNRHPFESGQEGLGQE